MTPSEMLQLSSLRQHLSATINISTKAQPHNNYSYILTQKNLTIIKTIHMSVDKCLTTRFHQLKHLAVPGMQRSSKMSLKSGLRIGSCLLEGAD